MGCGASTEAETSKPRPAQEAKQPRDPKPPKEPEPEKDKRPKEHVDLARLNRILINVK